MSLAELKDRARKRLDAIRATNDQGVYAKHYVEDATALLEALEAEERLFDRVAGQVVVRG